jgi:hypothetical protein
MTSILELHYIFHDEDLLAELHAAQQRRVVERTLFGAGRPSGMRLSIDDPVRRVKAALDARWRLSFDPGISERGYLAEDLLETTLFLDRLGSWHGAPYEAQVPIRWGGMHESAYDFVVSTRDLVISCKSSTSAPIQKLAPSSANVEQERRMLVADGKRAGTFWHTYMVHPGTLKARGPFEHTLTEQDVDRICMELEATIEAHKQFSAADDPTQLEEWNDPEYWRSEFGLESTSGAFVFERLDASAAIESRNRQYLRARARLREAKAEEEAAKALIREHVAEQLRHNPDARSVTAYGGDLVAAYSIDKRGALRCVEKPIEGGQV